MQCRVLHVKRKVVLRLVGLWGRGGAGHPRKAVGKPHGDAYGTF